MTASHEGAEAATSLYLVSSHLAKGGNDTNSVHEKIIIPRTNVSDVTSNSTAHRRSGPAARPNDGIDARFFSPSLPLNNSRGLQLQRFQSALRP